jgi:hypothetical protein
VGVILARFWLRFIRKGSLAMSRLGLLKRLKIVCDWESILGLNRE